MKTSRTRLGGPPDADRSTRSLSLACLVAVIALGLMGVLATAAAGPVASPPKNAPANDARAKAQALADLPAKLVGSTAGATREATDPRCGAPMVGTVWYGFSRNRPGTVQVSFQSASQLDAVVAVYQVVSD